MNYHVRSLINEHRYSDGIKILRKNLAHIRSSGNSEELIEELCCLGICYCGCGYLDDARQAFEEGLDLAKTTSNRKKESELLHELSTVVSKEGRIDEAIALSKKSLEIDLETGGEGTLPMHSLSIHYQKAGRFTEALEILTLAKKSAESRHDLDALGKCLHEMGLVCMSLSDFSTGIKYMVDSIQLKHRRNDLPGEQVTIHNLQACLSFHPEIVQNQDVRQQLQRLREILA